MGKIKYLTSIEDRYHSRNCQCEEILKFKCNISNRWSMLYSKHRRDFSVWNYSGEVRFFLQIACWGDGWMKIYTLLAKAVTMDKTDQF